MTDEQSNDRRDSLVSETYRKLADETTSADLDRQVLRMAANPAHAGSRPKNTFPVWTKPLAWAATIGLSLAIVLDVSRLSDPTLETAGSMAPPAAETEPDSVSDAFVPQDAGVMQDAREQARLRAGPNRQLPTSTDRPTSNLQTDAPALQSAPERSKDAVSERAAAVPKLQQESGETAAPQPAAGAVISTAEFRKDDKSSTVAAACDTESRETAEAWSECIRELRESGNYTAADREYASLISEYPDFFAE